MNTFIKYWIIGTLAIIGFFLIQAPPNQWILYLEYFLITPIFITLQQGAFLIIAGAIFGSALLIIKEMFSS
jgi:hypothetical protein